MDDRSFYIRVPKRWARIAIIVGVTAMIVAPLTAVATHSGFTDVDDSNTFVDDIAALAATGVTRGCNPPANTLYCPDDFVTREQMAAFMNRLGALDLATQTPVANAATALEAPPVGPAGGALSGSYPNPDLAPNEPFREVGTAGQPAFQNGWDNFSAVRTTVGFFKDQQDIVYLKGSLSGGTSGQTAFTLPPGYRPSAELLMPTGTGDLAQIDTLVIRSNGTVVPFCSGGCTASIGIDGLLFRVGPGGASTESLPPLGETPDG